MAYRAVEVGDRARAGFAWSADSLSSQVNLIQLGAFDDVTVGGSHPHLTNPVSGDRRTTDRTVIGLR